MTRRISLVAVCCSRASDSSAVARLQLREQPDVLDGDDGLVGEGLEQLDVTVREGAHGPVAQPDLPHHLRLSAQGHAEDAPDPRFARAPALGGASG